MDKLYKIDQNKILLIFFVSIVASILACWLGVYNQNGDKVFFYDLYNSLNGYPLKNFLALGSETVYHSYAGEPLFKIILWTASNIFIPSIVFDFFFILILFYCFFYIGTLQKFKFYILIILLICSFYIWIIVLSSIKNIIAIDFFLLSIIFFLKNKKFICIFFYALSVFVASGYIILFALFFVANLDKAIFFFKKNFLVTLFLLCIPVFFSYELMLARLSGYNIPAQHQTQNTIQKTQNTIHKKNYYELFIGKTTKKFSIELFSISYKSNKYTPSDSPRTIFLTYSILEIIKISLFLIVIFLSLKSNINFIPFALLAFFLSGIVSFEKMLLFLYLIFIMNFFVNHQEKKKYGKIQICFLLFFNSYYLYKQYQMLENLFKYNATFLY